MEVMIVPPEKLYEKARMDVFKKDYRRITVRTTDGSTLMGEVNIGIKERVSDLFTKGESQFIVLTNCENRGCSGKVLFINKSHIVWAEPED
ncbi:hypothetical protein SAMN02745216_02961 [Desulfatibacillum alkenivorans DSM 16219]|jgi:hypothetical protein|uniref:Uncharacterized protein n=1 Tax=Desulfatibacillum alkenivorans DSM 16219 TaxID=1121393 RepID=A0A1M6Q4W4_9BACT|nr:hypothetical protein [Desulfatibacillum alkenivorans]SHK15211.1 hypothetical protein SAMN02745216_02961 [Desulfatibacillum alkenivorans DSM 16219]